MSVLIITGPPASGKNTVADAMAKHLENFAVVDVDDLRDLVARPLVDVWEGDEGEKRRELGARNACALVGNFHDSGFDTVVLDVLTDATADIYRERLGNFDLSIVLLLPSESEINTRLLSRPDYLARGEIGRLYRQQTEFRSYDERLDNTELSPDDAAKWLLDRWPLSRP